MSAPQKRSLVLTMDAFGTLLRPRKPVVNQYREEAAKFGVTLFKHTEQDMENSFKTGEFPQACLPGFIEKRCGGLLSSTQ